MARFSAKLIPPPVLQLGKNETIPKGKEAFFQLFDKPVFSGKKDLLCGMVCGRSVDTKFLLETLHNTTKKLGVNL
jgi:hypothetical protein